MDSSGFSAPRSDCFPAGLRVLVVDDDPTWLKILEKMLKKCNYEVMTCNLAREALDLLRERIDGFDIVISDVNMPDMDGFKLLEHVGLEMDLPVIMMSVDGETSRVMKGVQHGACDYLLKPIRMKELRNIWQHVLRKRMHEIMEIEGHESFEKYQLLRNGTEQSDDGYLFSGDLISGKKRKDVDNMHDDKVCGDPSSVKKARVIWTVDLHQKFVKAVNQIGLSKVGPKKILDLMGMPWLTRENVASHLQKYRLYLSRLQKENELKVAFGGIKHSDISSKDTAEDVCLQNLSTQNSLTTQQSMVTNESFVVSGHKNPIQDSDKISEGNMTGLFSIPMAASKKALLGDVNESVKSSTSRISFNNSFGPLDSEIKSQLNIQAKYYWSTDVPLPMHADIPLPMHADIPLPVHHTQVDSKEPVLIHNPGPSSKEADKPTESDFKPSNGKARDQGTTKVTKVENTAAFFSVQTESHLTDCLSLNPIPCPMSNVKNLSLVQNLFDDMESSQTNLILETGSALRLWDEVLNGSCFQGDFHPLDTDLGKIESFDFNNKELIVDVPPNLYDSWNFDYASDPFEYPVIGQGLYIA